MYTATFKQRLRQRALGAPLASLSLIRCTCVSRTSFWSKQCQQSVDHVYIYCILLYIVYTSVYYRMRVHTHFSTLWVFSDSTMVIPRWFSLCKMFQIYLKIIKANMLCVHFQDFLTKRISGEIMVKMI